LSRKEDRALPPEKFGTNRDHVEGNAGQFTSFWEGTDTEKIEKWGGP